MDKAIEFTDDELNSASGAIQKVIDQYPDNKIIFANGGIEPQIIFLRWKNLKIIKM